MIRTITLSILLLSAVSLFAQDTFSIVAIDSLSGEIGSAGASCVGSSTSYPNGAQILSDVIPGVGAIHTQAAWLAANQQNAHNQMVFGNSPQEIIDYLVANDAGNNPTTRQYGIVDYNGGHPRAASYTGVNCSNYKNDTSNIYYSIQGNILLGQQILDSMQSRFLNTQGSLADRLMAALQGAKVIGADTRCADNGTSSQSSFLRVAKMTNRPDSLYCDLHMAYPQNLGGIYPVDPIDSLQTLFDEWKLLIVSAKVVARESKPTVKVFSDATGNTTFDFTLIKDYYHSRVEVYDLTGRPLAQFNVDKREQSIQLHFRGMAVYKVFNRENRTVTEGKFIVN
jgi:uncharacterized Ntn-hydrolase superfamily protein